jgi:septal ring factor EnvC (AmiA/AmiB activator)
VPEQGNTRQLLPGGPVRGASVDRRFAPTHHRIYRTPFGIGPVPLLAVVSAVALSVGLILLLTGAVIAGLVLMALTLASTALFRVATQDDPNSHTARLAMIAENRARGRARLAAATGRAWSRAVPELVRIRARQERLNRELNSRLEPLGEAVHRGDDQHVESLKAEAERLEHAIEQAAREARAVREAAEHDVDRERAPILETKALTPQTTRAPQSRGRRS